MRTFAAGPRALLVEVDNLDAVLALQAEIARRRAAGWCPTLQDVVPAARTVLLDGLDDPEGVARELATWAIPPASEPEGGEVSIEVVYDGEDLAHVARLWKVDVDEVIERHTAEQHTVAFCGFAPGFAYLRGLPDYLSVPRRKTPRPAVPPGAVGLAGSFTGIYPRASPGGWQLIGRTNVPLWDPRRRPAALLPPGTRVRFRAAAR